MSTYHIITYGCQMNENDSEKLAKMLTDLGYTPTDSPKFADILIMNTCSVRENADVRFFGNLGYMKNLKKETGMLIAVCGCMMQQEHIVEQIVTKYPFVDVLFGTHNIEEFPALLSQRLASGKAAYKVDDKARPIAEGLGARRRYAYKASVTVMQGCNNFCSYCIVPYTRGRERSRKPEDILREVKTLAAEDVKEIMLLGQNVNSYGIADGLDTTFADLLRKINEIEGIKRIRFMTSHPKDLSTALIDAMAECEHVCKHLHLPLQSGSSRILGLMNRRYDQARYLSLIEEIKTRIPAIGLTTDIIVGFPTESEEDFAQTMKVMETVRFDGAYTFIFSPRKGTKAAEYDYEIDKDVIQERFQRLLDAQKIISGQNNAAFLNREVEVLVEGHSKSDITRQSGRTNDNRIVNFVGSAQAGSFANVQITNTKSFYLEGMETVH